MKTNCSKDDYDFYTIPFPVKVIFNRQKNRYISSQLEKLHPCFSDDCSYDSHLRLKKFGLIADVVVMQKFKVAEYKANKRKLFVQELKHHQFFADKKKSLVVAGGVICVFLLLIFCLNMTHGKNDFEMQAESSVMPTDAVIPVQRLRTPQLLFQIKESAGSIKELSWSYDGYNEKMSVRVYGVYPEQLQDLSPACNISLVVFEDQVPVMTINMTEHIVQKVTAQTQDYYSFKNTFRNEIISSEIVLIEETVNPYGVKLSVHPGQMQSLKDLFLILKAQNMQLSSIYLNIVNRFIYVELVFAQAMFDEQSDLIDAIIRTLDYLKVEQIAQASVQASINQQQAQPQQIIQSQTAEQLQKLGQIHKPDGTIISYYKNQNGKIIKR